MNKRFIGVLLFGLIVYGSFWLGNLVMSATGLDTTEGVLATVLAGGLPVALGYFAWTKYGRSYE